MGLTKNATIYGLAAMAANIRKGVKFVTEYGLPEPLPWIAVSKK